MIAVIAAAAILPGNGETITASPLGTTTASNQGQIVGAIANELGINGRDIGSIRIHDHYTTVALPGGMPPRFKRTSAESG